ncbi:MAG: DEAD/DEAH box helicase [Myxococcaceae bacterium]|nr:MAG: DEAD/DEAH box helicase [Myxococcaceae bacterium]
MTTAQFSPGSLVRARGREWIVLNGSDAEVLRVRPISGSEADQTFLHLGLEVEPVTDATFPLPTVDQVASHGAAALLRDALLLSLRRGAGPFRAVGQIAVEPRAYQLVPLLMALKLDVVRLLIADDVGVGKTIEAALIARELVDRGDIDRFTVLCPPHLVEQWTAELDERFHLRAVPVTATGAARLERDLPVGDSIFYAHPFTVVSLDYIKNDKRRSDFLRACPNFVIVDEAHACAGTGQGQQKRYQLLADLATDSKRQLVLLTATPHSGDEGAFYRLLGLLDPAFATLQGAQSGAHRQLRDELSKHFVQRRRPDIAEWSEGELFPRRLTTELTYKLGGAWERFFGAVLDYCATVVAAAEGDARRQRLNFWGTLALMRCVASSPAAALLALRTRAGTGTEASEDETLVDRVFDGAADRLDDDDLEPPVASDAPALDALIAQAEHLAGTAGDPKLALLSDHVKKLVEEGFNPVVFCRYIATARYVAKHLQERLKNVAVGVVTGEITSDERREKVDALGESEQSRVLVATDCLSEGINLQDAFDAVVHYDLSWNPTRHEQREGRVDRFGQKKKTVRATLIYGANNPVDGAVLEVILRKATKIREELGVSVPLPDDNHTLTQALMKAVLLRKRGDMRQQSLDFGASPDALTLDTRWSDAAEKARQNLTIFAQRRMKPEDVLVEWKKALAAVGGRAEVERFVGAALARFGAGLEALRSGFKAPLSTLPPDLRERLDAEGLAGTLFIDFAYPPPARCHAVHRSHPLVSVLAEALLERTLAAGAVGAQDDLGVLGRAGCWVSSAVTKRTVVAILRLRHQLTVQRAGVVSSLLVEEAAALAWVGATTPRLVEGDAALALLVPPPAGDLPAAARTRVASQALGFVGERTADLDAFAQRRADALLKEHREVRDASEARGRYGVKALLPADVIGVYVLMPQAGDPS